MLLVVILAIRARLRSLARALERQVQTDAAVRALRDSIRVVEESPIPDCSAVSWWGAGDRV